MASGIRMLKLYIANSCLVLPCLQAESADPSCELYTSLDQTPKEVSRPSFESPNSGISARARGGLGHTVNTTLAPLKKELTRPEVEQDKHSTQIRRELIQEALPCNRPNLPCNQPNLASNEPKPYDDLKLMRCSNVHAGAKGTRAPVMEKRSMRQVMLMSRPACGLPQGLGQAEGCSKVGLVLFGGRLKVLIRSIWGCLEVRRLVVIRLTWHRLLSAPDGRTRKQ